MHSSGQHVLYAADIHAADIETREANLGADTRAFRRAESEARTCSLGSFTFVDVDVAAGSAFTHRHTDLHLCVVVSGGFEQRLGGEHRQCSAPHVRISPPGSESEVRFDADSRCFLVHARGAAAVDDVVVPERACFSSTAETARLSLELVDAFAVRDDHVPLHLESLTIELFAQATKWREGRRSRRPPPWLRRTRELIHECYQQSIDIAMLADASAVAKTHVTRAFRTHYGCSPGEYLRALRLEQARARLEKTDMPVAHVAAETGFFDQSHLTRLFTKTYGLPPVAYRSRARQS